MWVCRHVRQLADRHHVTDLDAILVAALFHDAVYDPTSRTNEADSARLASRAVLDLSGWTDDRRSLVEQLILATADHNVTAEPFDAESALGQELVLSKAILLDADLAVLGADPAAYDAYRRGVRDEYSHLGDSEWQIGRRSVLRSLLERPRLYSTETMRVEREARARANLTAELADLR